MSGVLSEISHSDWQMPLSSQLPHSFCLPGPVESPLHTCGFALTSDSSKPSCRFRNPSCPIPPSIILSHVVQLPQGPKLQSLFPAAVFGFHSSRAMVWKVPIGRNPGRARVSLCVYPVSQGSQPMPVLSSA